MRRPDWQAPYVDEDPPVGLGVGDRLRRTRIILGMRERAPDGIAPARHSVIGVTLKYFEIKTCNTDVQEPFLKPSVKIFIVEIKAPLFSKISKGGAHHGPRAWRHRRRDPAFADAAEVIAIKAAPAGDAEPLDVLRATRCSWRFKTRSPRAKHVTYVCHANIKNSISDKIAHTSKKYVMKQNISINISRSATL